MPTSESGRWHSGIRRVNPHSGHAIWNRNRHPHPEGRLTVEHIDLFEIAFLTVIGVVSIRTDVLVMHIERLLVETRKRASSVDSERISRRIGETGKGHNHAV